MRKPTRQTLLRTLASLAVLPVLARCFAECLNAAVHTHIPVVTDKQLAATFTLFSLTHATTLLGARRALTFFTTSVLISFAFEAIGVHTGLIFGAYRYGTLLGPQLAGVPILIPFCWFMMIYCSWFVAHILMQDAADPLSYPGLLTRAFAASCTMTVWDTIMDPTMAAQGQWTWTPPGMYFGVPIHNFLGWLLTTFIVYLLTGLFFRAIPNTPAAPTRKLYTSLPIAAYLSVAIARVFIAQPPQLRVFAAFSMVLLGTLALLRHLFVPHTTYLPG